MDTFVEAIEPPIPLLRTESLPVQAAPHLTFIAHVQMSRGVAPTPFELKEKLNSAFVWALKMARPTDQLVVAVSSHSSAGKTKTRSGTSPPSLLPSHEGGGGGASHKKVAALRRFYETSLQYNSGSPFHRVVSLPAVSSTSEELFPARKIVYDNWFVTSGPWKKVKERYIDGPEEYSHTVPNAVPPTRDGLHEILKYAEAASKEATGASLVLILEMLHGILPPALLQGSDTAEDFVHYVPRFPFSLMLSGRCAPPCENEAGSDFKEIPLLQETVGVTYLVCVKDSKKSWEAYQVLSLSFSPSLSPFLTIR